MEDQTWPNGEDTTRDGGEGGRGDTTRDRGEGGGGGGEGRDGGRDEVDTSVLVERQVSQLLACPEENEFTPILQSYAKTIDTIYGIAQP